MEMAAIAITLLRLLPLILQLLQLPVVEILVTMPLVVVGVCLVSRILLPLLPAVVSMGVPLDRQIL
jgi:hypothetical protein